MKESNAIDEVRMSMNEIHLLADGINSIGLALSSPGCQMEGLEGGLGVAVSMLSRQIKQVGDKLNVECNNLVQSHS